MYTHKNSISIFRISTYIYKHRYFSGDHVTSQVNDRTKLVVGAMVSMVTKCNETWAGDVTKRLESLVGVHGK